MQRQDFDYPLPNELIARHPTADRVASRLLCLKGVNGDLAHLHFSDVIDQVEPGDLMVFNDTRVIPARLFGRKATGGKLEILVERLLDEYRVLAHVRSSKSPKVGATLILDDETPLTLVARHDALFELAFPQGQSALDVMKRIGHIPLPPYIDRADEEEDRERYQTVYGKKEGAVAAPTAGLHFDDALLQKLKDKGVNIAFVTLHVGAGTFQPVRVDDIDDHIMHSEVMELSAAVAAQVRATKLAGKRVIAVGTTSVRCLETAAQKVSESDAAMGATDSLLITAYRGDTDIFIYPGYQYRVIDALITNFHLPESTLLMLVSAFAGYKQTMAAYQVAVAERYRFFSYGDAMFITRNPNAETQI